MPTLRLAPASTADYRRLAERRLPRFMFDYLDGGSYYEETLARNVADFRELSLKQRVMRDVSELDLSTEVLGEKWAMPVALSPIGLGGMMARRAEAQAIRAAEAASVPFCLSTVSICSLEEVAKAATRPFWFQLYMLRDRGAVLELLQRAKGVGCQTLAFTVDLAVLGARYRDVRNGMSGGARGWAKLRGGPLSYLLHPRWTWDVGVNGKPHVFGNLKGYVAKATSPGDFKAWVDNQFDPSVTWKDIEWLRENWSGKLVIKGVLSLEDTIAAANAGADGVIVSNHGGRQLDGVSSTIAMLPRIAEAVGGRVCVLIDGGVRNGLDVVKAIASGAKAAMIGRPWAYAVAARGEAGVTRLLATFREEMKVAMALTGCRRISEIDGGVIERGG